MYVKRGMKIKGDQREFISFRKVNFPFRLTIFRFGLRKPVYMLIKN